MTPRAATTPRNDDDETTMEVFDPQGRVVRVSRDSWRDGVLLPTLEAAKGDEERLYVIVVAAVSDGFAEAVVPFAEYFARTCTSPLRGAGLLGAALIACGRLDDAGAVLSEATRDHGEDAIVFCNMARVHEGLNDEEKAGEMLWKALTLDPNQDFGFAWFLDRSRGKGGHEATRAACERVAALEGAWRARVILASYALKHGDADSAARLYAEAIAMAPKPVPSDLLLQMSGDLGKAKKLQELVDRVAPLFDPKEHDFYAGANLMKGYLGLDRRDDAQKIFDVLCKEERADWQERLENWRAILAAAAPNAPQA